MRKLDTTTKKQAALAGAFLLFMFVVFLPLFFSQLLIFQKKPLTPIIEETPKVFEEVPTNYFDCLKTDKDFNVYDKESELRCGYTVHEKEDESRFRECLKNGGVESTLIIDTFDSLNPGGYENFCDMVFYNSDYEFPKDFEECEREHKGGIVGGDGSTVGGVPRPKTCLASVDLVTATNKNVAIILLNKCIDLGGDYNSRTSSCLIKFNEPTS